jgi:hypothetical protein
MLHSEFSYTVYGENLIFFFISAGYIGWETKYKDVREWTKEVRQGREKGTDEWLTEGREDQKMNSIQLKMHRNER